MLAAGLVAVVCGMVGVSFAAVPLYKMFCAATGYGGMPQIGPLAAPGATPGSVIVRFDADINPGLPWQFAPEQRQVRVTLGEERVAFYAARNEADRPMTGVAVYNVTPDKVGRYFHKTACFCFNEQTLSAGQSMQFPVSFWVDPAIARDRDTAEVHEITLSYTFFHSLDDAANSNALAHAGTHVGAYAGTLTR